MKGGIGWNLRISGVERFIYNTIILFHIVRIVCITSPELQPMAVQYRFQVIQTEITWPVYCTAIGWSSGDVIRTIWIYVIILSIISRSKPEILRLGYRRFQIGCVFAEYDLFKPTTFIQTCIYMNFRIILTQLYILISWDIR